MGCTRSLIPCFTVGGTERGERTGRAWSVMEIYFCFCVLVVIVVVAAAVCHQTSGSEEVQFGVHRGVSLWRLCRLPQTSQ